MKEEFFNEEADNYISFTDDGIIYKNLYWHVFFPYGSIDKIKISLSWLDIESKRNDIFHIKTV